MNFFYLLKIYFLSLSKFLFSPPNLSSIENFLERLKRNLKSVVSLQIKLLQLWLKMSLKMKRINAKK